MSATVIVNNDSCTGEYDMFDVHSFDLEGEVQSAVLRGPLFLEIGEALTLRVLSGKDQLDLKATVQAVDDKDQLMTVRFVGLDERGKAALAARKNSQSASAGKKSVDTSEKKSADEK
jgi:hypothetical protein